MGDGSVVGSELVTTHGRRKRAKERTTQESAGWGGGDGGKGGFEGLFACIVSEN